LVELNHWSEHDASLFTDEFVKGLFQQAGGILILTTFKPIGIYFSLVASLKNYESGVFKPIEV